MTLRGRDSAAPALNGRVVCLWAGQAGRPEEPAYQSEAEEAVISLTRAVLASGGRLALLADDAIGPLVAQLGGEYAEPPRLETERAPGEHRTQVALIVHAGLERPTVEVLSFLQRSGVVDLMVPAPDQRRLEPWPPGSPLPEESSEDLWHGLVKFAEPIAVVAVAGPADWMATRDLSMGTGVPGFLIETAAPAGLWMDGNYGEVTSVVRRYVTPELTQRAGLRLEGTPYPFLMQCLVEELAHGDRPA